MAARQFTPPADTSPVNPNLRPSPAAPPPPAGSPRPPHSTKAPNSPGRGSYPTPPYSAPPPAASPSPATPHTAGKNKSSALPTSAAASPQQSAQTYFLPLPQPPPQSPADSVNKKWIALGFLP